MKKRLVLLSLLILAPAALAGCKSCEETLKEAAEEAEGEAREQAKKAVDDAFDAAKDAFFNVRDKIRKSDSVMYAVPPSRENIEKALAWAKEREKNGDWKLNNECLTFVKHAYTEGAGLPKFVLPADGSIDTATKARDRAQTALKAVEKPENLNEYGLYGGEPPSGAWVYYMSSDPRGHVALSVGDGKVIHVVGVNVKEEDYRLGKSFNFKGWSWPPPSREEPK